jgi:hypothetical protein
LLKLVVFRRLAWKLADHGIMRERIEESFKRRLVVRIPDGERARTVSLIDDAALDAHALSKANSAR